MALIALATATAVFLAGGGDGFWLCVPAVLAPETGDRGTQTLALRICQAVGDVTAGLDAVRASVGIAIFPDDGVTATTLLDVADQRLLAAKRGRQHPRGRRRAA
ncbi:MAG TPA: hypothetical protein VG275_07575 [Solirubrobacteraceae bacterium]|nr:hypothetical protein [Solirubrobacteraceae bacterium]